MKHILRSIFLFSTLGTLGAFAQQTGSISGEVTANGSALPGVTISATADVLPRGRSTVTTARGEYRLTLLPPGNYELTFTMDGLGTVTRKTKVVLQQNTVVDVTMRQEASAEEMQVIAEVPLIDITSAEVKAAITDDVFDKLPVGQEYRDLVKLTPGVQYTEDKVRGPSAGGSGQDNVYYFDGVNVTTPLFGTLSAEPSSHDIEQVAIVKGGAKAMDFNRSGGFTINTISKAGTNAFHGEVSYQLQDHSLSADEDTPISFVSDIDKSWLVANVGGPILQERLFFYASYYGPTEDRGSQANLYGDVPDYESERDEFFLKLTFSPTDNIMLNASYRDSERDITANGVIEEFVSGTATSGNSNELKIGILEGYWLLNEQGSLSFKYSDFENKTSGRPDNFFGLFAAIDGSSNLDINNLDRQGHFTVPTLRDGEEDYNLFASDLIDRYGYIDNGVRTGGGEVGGAELINDQDFFRESFQIAYDHFLNVGDTTHDLHFGYQRYEESEEFQRQSNGWGFITYIGNRDTDHPGAYYRARFRQGSLTGQLGEAVGLVRSEFKSQSIEINDTIGWGDWTFNVGFVFSNDELIGQGLAEDSSTVSGFRLSPESAYTMYEVDWDDQIQPRMSVTWNFMENDTLFASWATYNPAASSLPRAASWARNLIARRIDAFFDENGNYLESTDVSSSSGKFFQPNMTPRTTQEYIVGFSKQLSSEWTGKVYARHKYSHHFWEDTNNNARSRFGNTDDIRSQPDYIPELGDYRAEVGGSSYVIADLDGAANKFYEVNFDGEWRGEKTYFKGSYTWSHYYGNIDQDNSTTDNDQNIFIGSSNIADGAGRQLWDMKYGNLRGDRRHQLKVYGHHALPWSGTVGAFAIYQSGQPWEAWDVEVYRDLTGSSSDTIRFAEPAGSRTTSGHYQVDLNYTHEFRFLDKYLLQAKLDFYNITDNQTGYDIQSKVNTAGFGDARNFYDPRRIQLMLKFSF